MLALGAQYTLSDREAPDLEAVARDIAAEPDGAVRRKRAAALLHVLGRAWEARYARDTEIVAAEANRKWYSLGKVPAFWLWRLRDEISWLDNEHGTPVRPAQLRRRTEATALVYGADTSKVLHPDIQKSVERREPVLRALKVGGEPTTADIVERLRQLRSAELDGEPADVPAAMLLYRVLAGRTVPSRASDGDLSRSDLIKTFTEGPGLVRTDTGWRTPASCLRGKPIFGAFREFAPPVAGGDVLWEMLDVPEPSVDDAIAVIRELSRLTPSTSGSQLDAEGQAVVLQSLQLLQTYAAGAPDALKGKPLRRLPLWTDRGWVRHRPVYALADETMASQLGIALSASGHAGAVWRPGTDLEHVGDVAARLGVTLLGAGSMVPRVGVHPRPDTGATTRFAAAVAHLREDLQRRDPVTTQELSGPWEDLAELIVCVVPHLTMTVTLPDGTVAEVLARAAIDTAQGLLLVTDRSELGRFASVGQAVADRFRSRRSQVAYAWPVAWERAEAGHAAVDITRAEDRIAALNTIVDAELHQRLAGFREANVTRHTASAERTADRMPPESSPQAGRSLSAMPQVPAARNKRRLIDPAQWRPILTPTAEPNSPRSAPGGSESASRPALAAPKKTAAIPRPRQGARGFTADDQEQAALDLVRAALARDCEELRDLRAQRGLGADAMDEQDRFYEIKSTLSTEQDSVSLTLHEYERALTEKDFFLVIVSGLDRSTSTPPTVRIILDPLRHLTLRAAPDVLLTGIRSCPSIPIPFERNE
ncbi:hypothetical protein ACFQ9J_13740 [Streptomyces sp. NPDC056529]|uniref:hypothetical protein n=1 Tax=Streptomyces sp. NPDC056529 TaxID=3345855 RepID=UPI0036A04101